MQILWILQVILLKKWPLGPKLLSMEMPILNFCLWNCQGDSEGRSLEFEIPYPILTYLPKKVKKGHGIPNSELLPLELPW